MSRSEKKIQPPRRERSCTLCRLHQYHSLQDRNHARKRAQGTRRRSVIALMIATYSVPSTVSLHHSAPTGPLTARNDVQPCVRQNKTFNVKSRSLQDDVKIAQRPTAQRPTPNAQRS